MGMFTKLNKKIGKNKNYVICIRGCLHQIVILQLSYWFCLLFLLVQMGNISLLSRSKELGSRCQLAAR